MVSERYREASADGWDSEEDCASMASVDDDDEHASDIVFGGFGDSDLDAVCVTQVTPIEPMKPTMDGSTIKIGEITCFFVTFNSSAATSKLCQQSSPSTAMAAMDPTDLHLPLHDQNLHHDIDALFSFDNDVASPFFVRMREVEEETMKSNDHSNSFAIADLVCAATEKPKKLVTVFKEVDLVDPDPANLVPDHSISSKFVSSGFDNHGANFGTVLADLLVSKIFTKILPPFSVDSDNMFSVSIFYVGFNLPTPDPIYLPWLEFKKFVSATTVPSPEKTAERIITVAATLPRRSVFVFDPGGATSAISVVCHLPHHRKFQNDLLLRCNSVLHFLSLLGLGCNSFSDNKFRRSSIHHFGL